MSVFDTLFNIFKGANPDASDEDIRAHLESMKASPEQMQAAASPFAGDDPSSPDNVAAVEQPAPQATLSMPKAPDMSLNIPDANSVPSNFDVATSDNTVTMNGRPASLPSGNATAAMPPAPDLPPEPTAEAPAAPSPAAPASKAPAAPKSSPDELKTLLSAPEKSGADDAAAASARRKHNLGIIPVAAAGIGDAISNAASAFGAKGTAGTQEKVVEGLNTSADKDKAAFEDKQRKDPTSDVSRHYQKVLGLMLGDKAKGFNLPSMSAENIASTLPEVEKYMQKELGLKQIQSNKELSHSVMQQNRQDKLEKEGREWYDNLSKARNGELGVQNAKVDQARHLLQLYKQAEESGKPINNSQYGELAIGAANLVAGGAQNVSDHTRQMIMQSTAKGDLNKALTYAGFDPSSLGGTTDAVLHSLKDTILRQGGEAEKQRDKFIQDHKNSMPSGLDPKQFDRLTSTDLGNSLKEFQPTAKVRSHPQDQEALSWAKAHYGDPRAAKILKANGF